MSALDLTEFARTAKCGEGRLPGRQARHRDVCDRTRALAIRMPKWRQSAAGWWTGANYRLTTQRGRNVILRTAARAECQPFRLWWQRLRIPRRS